MTQFGSRPWLGNPKFFAPVPPRVSGNPVPALRAEYRRGYDDGFAAGLAAAKEPEPEATPLRKTMHAICREVAAKHRVSFDDLVSERRTKQLTLARFEAMWRCKNETLHSFPQIGRVLRRDHTTVHNGIRRYEEMRGRQ